MSNPQKTCTTCTKPLPEGCTAALCPACSAATSAGVDDDATQVGDWLEDSEWLRERLPDYEMLSELGRGGMGRVLLARQTSLDRLVAIKILSLDLADDTDFVQRFQREAKAMARLVHPNIIQIYDFGQQDRQCYIIMEYSDGTNLSHLIREQKLKPDQALTIVSEICDALQFAHNQGVVHRDIKPANVLVGKDGRVKVTDFGIAKIVHEGEEHADDDLTMTGQAMGTPAYAAPEQKRDMGKVDHRADIFSLGVMFYEMLTGDRPLGRFELPSKKAKVNAQIDHIVLKAIEENPDRRYQAISEVKMELERTTRKQMTGPGSTSNAVKGLAIGIAALALVTAAIILPKYFKSQDTPATPPLAVAPSTQPPPAVPAVTEPEAPAPTTTPTLSLQAIIPLKAQVDRAWEQLKGFSPDHGVGDKLSELDTQIRSAHAYYDRDAFDKSAGMYSNALKTVDSLRAFEAERTSARNILDGPTFTPTLDQKNRFPEAWTDYEAARSKLRSAFSDGDFATVVEGAQALRLAYANAVAASKPPGPTPEPTHANVEPATEPEPESERNVLEHPEIGDTITLTLTPTVAIEMCYIPPGKFTMGSPNRELGRAPDEWQHEVEIAHGLWMSQTEITQGQYIAATGFNPSQFVDDLAPVDHVSWEDARLFCQQMNRNCPPELAKWMFRLPTEAEWEYACRAGTTTATPFGKDLSGRAANFNGNSPLGNAPFGPFLQQTCRVKQYEPNAWGLYDTIGNLWEWCMDDYDETYYSRSATKDPQNLQATGFKVIRGGSWFNEGYDCRSANRGWCNPLIRNNLVGFRLVIARQ